LPRGGGDRLADRSGFGPLRERLPHLAVADPLERVRRRWNSLAEPLPHLLDETGLEEGIDPLRDAARVRLAIPVEADLQRAVSLLPSRPGPLAREALAPGPLSGERDLEGADDPLGVSGRDSLRGGGVEAAEPAVEPRRAPPRGHLAKAGAERLAPRGRRDDAAKEPPQIEARSPDDDRHAAARGDVRDRLLREPDVLRQGEVDPRVGDVDEVVRDGSPIRRRRLRGGRVEPAVHLHRVAADDLAAQPSGRFERDVGLADRRRTDEDEETDQAPRFFLRSGLPAL
jgi:hypothetical protein